MGELFNTSDGLASRAIQATCASSRIIDKAAERKAYIEAKAAEDRARAEGKPVKCASLAHLVNFLDDEDEYIISEVKKVKEDQANGKIYKSIFDNEKVQATAAKIMAASMQVEAEKAEFEDRAAYIKKHYQSVVDEVVLKVSDAIAEHLADICNRAIEERVHAERMRLCAGFEQAVIGGADTIKARIAALEAENARLKAQVENMTTIIRAQRAQGVDHV